MVKEFDLNDSDSYIERTDTKCETLSPFDLHIKSKWQDSMDKGHFRYTYFQIIYILISQLFIPGTNSPSQSAKKSMER